MNKIIQFFLNLFKREQMENGKGLLKDPIDYRDIELGSIFKKSISIPEKYNVPFKMKIKNQGYKPYCVGYSCATIKEFLEQREQNNIEFDGEWLYKECKKIDNYNGDGTYFRAGFKVLKNKGALPVGASYYDELAYSRYRIGGYAKVKLNFQDLKEAIYRYGAVVVGFRGSNQGWSTPYIRPPRSGERQWGHAVSLAVGYTKDRIVLQNSWGKRKGDKGYYYFGKDYLPISAWVVLVDLPNDWKELLKKENKPKHQFNVNLSRGIKSDGVKALQDCLKWYGCFHPKIDSTGYFGPITWEAVKVFQQREGIKPVAGFVGRLTRARLNKIFA